MVQHIYEHAQIRLSLNVSCFLVLFETFCQTLGVQQLKGAYGLTQHSDSSKDQHNMHKQHSRSTKGHILHSNRCEHISLSPFASPFTLSAFSRPKDQSRTPLSSLCSLPFKLGQRQACMVLATTSLLRPLDLRPWDHTVLCLRDPLASRSSAPLFVPSYFLLFCRSVDVVRGGR
ncbi:hypothetical protein EUGRSUZ_H00575 [Eucalyptus grandis]|uniref:Uncharacterized protein n=2 Tax=Eucalyptus grandis TaxID=71139 RepID=A0ACC3JM50_EUCGR|nr:hypothetical protein EUGRSUZ_H00575 [Eucalyptus grandis]